MYLNMVRAHITISGEVQGIGYRYFAKRLAAQYNIAGWVRNNYDGTVEFDIEGEKNNIEEYIEKLKKEHPWATVISVDIKWLPYSGIYSQFSVR
ncbi:MAG: acylphosphatase [Elusimicrobiota bacterium]|nr:acylphosphatase [Elusimicrobiota bacterium]